MRTREDPAIYLETLSRRHWSTWVWATSIALAMNLMLFVSMPYLLHRQPAEPVYDRLVSHINVIRIKRPDSVVRRKTFRPPEPQEKSKEPPPGSPRQTLQAKLSLPFDVNPCLPGGPDTLNLPPLTADAFHLPGVQDAFAIGDLDGPLTPLGRITPVYPMDAKRRGIQGWVKVKFVVNDQGSVERLAVVDAKPPGVFDKSVIRCVSKWRFKPGTVEGLPVKAWVETTIRFELD
jgi:protein TonB